ncbi:hypothetical protein OROHE_016749 [Orobanche hederae]
METGWLKLPTDLKVDIFDRIPKDNELISLKVICKDWNFVISKFCAPNLSPPNCRARFFGIFCLQELPEISKSLTPRLMPIIPMLGRTFQIECSILSLMGDAGYIRDCCNGMILIASSNSTNSQYYVGNPLTGQRFPIPVNPNRSTMDCSLVFDPSILLTDDKDPFFKIISFVRPAEQATVSHPMEVDIYSFDKGEWCIHIVDLEPYHQPYGFGWMERSVYFNRALYSLSFAMYLVCIDNVIPTRNSGMQDFLNVWSIALPDKDDNTLIPNPGQCGCIGTCSGRFYYSNRNVQGSSILVWMLGNSEWVLMHNISIRDDIGFGTLLSKKV